MKRCRAWSSFMSTFIIFRSFRTSLKFIFPSLFLSAFWNQSQTHLRRCWGKHQLSFEDLFNFKMQKRRRDEPAFFIKHLTAVKGYWSSLSFSSIVSALWISLRNPWIQAWASSGDSATRSRLPWRPWNTKVKQRSAGNSSAMLSRTSDWWPSRTASTSVIETVTGTVYG